MAVMKTLIGQKCRPLKNLLFVFDTGEEGLGNCRGTRQLMQDYKDKVDEVISFDLGSDAVCVKAVGSKRYRVTVTAPGGHSFHAFGQKGAIETAAEMIHEIYRIKPCEGTQTTYNVGMIEGGTSVNTIAQSVHFLQKCAPMMRRHCKRLMNSSAIFLILLIMQRGLPKCRYRMN